MRHSGPTYRELPHPLRARESVSAGRVVPCPPVQISLFVERRKRVPVVRDLPPTGIWNFRRQPKDITHTNQEPFQKPNVPGYTVSCSSKTWDSVLGCGRLDATCVFTLRIRVEPSRVVGLHKRAGRKFRDDDASGIFSSQRLDRDVIVNGRRLHLRPFPHQSRDSVVLESVRT